MTSHPRWFSWGSTLAVVAADGRAFSMGADGWLSVAEPDVTWDGREISQDEARRAFASSFDALGEPPLISG
jgi:hypothetical protein